MGIAKKWIDCALYFVVFCFVFLFYSFLLCRPSMRNSFSMIFCWFLCMEYMRAVCLYKNVSLIGLLIVLFFCFLFCGGDFNKMCAVLLFFFLLCLIFYEFIFFYFMWFK